LVSIILEKEEEIKVEGHKNEVSTLNFADHAYKDFNEVIKSSDYYDQDED
jgi:hypothetical protein